MTTKEALGKLVKRIPDYAVVIAESKDGHCNVGADGDGFALLNAITHLIDSVARSLNTDYPDVISACAEIRAFGYEYFEQKYRTKDSKAIMYQGVEIGCYDEGITDKSKDEQIKALEKEIACLKGVIKKLSNELEWKDNTIDGIKDNMAQMQASHDKQVKGLMKDLNKAEHKCDTCILRKASERGME